MTSQILTEWGRWSECSGSCGIGYSKRHRSCLVLDRCYGKTMETKRCSLQPCPVVWGDWASWSACSATCGVGFADRRRTCFRRKGVAQETCNGYDVENRECYLTACKKHNNSLSTLEGFLIAAPFIGMSMLAFVFIIAKYCIKRRNSLKNRQVDSSPKEYDYRSSPVNSINSFSNDSHVKVKRSQSVTKAKRSNSAVTRGERSFVNVSAPTGYYKKNVRNNEKIQRETMRYTHYDGDRRDNKEKRKVSSEFQRIKTTRPRPTSNIYENYCGDYQDSHLPERENFKIPGSIPLSDTRLRQPVHTSHMKQTSVNGGRESAGNRVNTDHQLSRHSSKKSVKMRHHPSQTSSECFQFDKQMHLPKSVKIKEEHTLSSLQDMRTVKGSMSKESLRNSDYYFLPIKNETNQAQHKLTRNTSSSLKTSNVSHLKSESTLNSGKHRQQPVRQNLPRPKLSLYRDEPRLFNDRTELPMADTLTRALSVALATQEIRTDVTPQLSEQETRMLKAKTNGSIQSRNGNRKGRIRSHTSTNKYDNSARSHNTFRKSYSVLSVNTRDIKPTRFDDVTNLQSVSNNERSNELTLEVDKHDQQNGIKHDTSNSRVPTINSRVPSSNSRVPTTNSQVSTPNSGVATSNLRVPTSKSQVPTPNLRVPTSNSRVPTSNSSVGGEQQTAYRQEPNRLSDERYKPFQREDADNDTSPSNAHNKSLQGSPSNEHDLTGIISSSHIPKTSTPISARRTFNSEKRHLSSKQDPRNVKEDSKKRVQLDGEIKTNDTYPPDVNHTDFVNFCQWKHSLSNNGTQNGGSLSNNGTQNGGCNKIKNPDSIQSELLLSTTEEQQNRVHKYFGLASDLSSELSSDGECFFSVPSSCQDLTELP
ncbi:uncharacterized protein [Antedon mediterranea]|uniref:uncharacterized protein n=1 Tax=Antedon mediterranea TaxID=105859 RepID=UPI003AF4128A